MDYEKHILDIVSKAKKPVPFADVKSALEALAEGRVVGYRDVDRALQRLRRQKRIEYVNSSGERKTHGWRAVQGST